MLKAVAHSVTLGYLCRNAREWRAPCQTLGAKNTLTNLERKVYAVVIFAYINRERQV